MKGFVVAGALLAAVAGRVSGDSTVAYALAFGRAVDHLLDQ